MDYRPWTWEPPKDFNETRKGISRQDALEKTSGKAVYTRDVYLPGMLYAKILTSPYANAKIRRLDSGRAKALSGVRDILTYTDPDIVGDMARGYWYEMTGNYNIPTL